MGFVIWKSVLCSASTWANCFYVPCAPYLVMQLYDYILYSFMYMIWISSCRFWLKEIRLLTLLLSSLLLLPPPMTCIPDKSFARSYNCSSPWSNIESFISCSFSFADNLTDPCEKMVCLCDQEAAQCWGTAPYNPQFVLWPDFLCGQTHPTCHFRYGGSK